MSSKGKKSKKRSKPVNDVTRNRDVATNKKIHAYFTNEEIAEIKSVMKTKDATGVPFVIAATVLCKLDLLKKLLKDGYSINQTGQNNMTALMWAVKHKYLDLVDFLLTNGADPTLKTESGDNVLILALEHKLWDEQSVIALWKAVKKISFIDVNFTNKNGHNMLHMCVRRDWEELLKILLSEKPDVDAGNSNGVTPLMLASFRNNVAIVEILIEAGADILKEDHHERMTLCYAISSAMKIAQPPFLAAEKIVRELKKNSSLDTYLKRRVELIAATAKKSEISCSTSEMLVKIIQFGVQYIDEGVRILLDCDAFALFFQVIESRLDQTGTVKFLLKVCEEVLFYNEDSEGYNPELHLKINEAFYESGFADVCLEVINVNNFELSKIAFDLLILAFFNDDKWTKLLEENCNILWPLLNDHQIITHEQTRVKILMEKKRKMKSVFDNINIDHPSSDKSDERKKSENGVGHSKRSRRRSKAIKARLTKIKNVELGKRINGKLSQKRSSNSQSNSGATERLEFFLEPEEVFKNKNPIITSLQHLLKNERDLQHAEIEDNFPKWKKHFLRLARNDVSKHFQIDAEKLYQAVEHLRSPGQKFDTNTSHSLNVIIDYLKQLVQMMVRKYREHWENDRAAGNCTCHESNEHVPWLYSRHLKNIEMKEREIVQDLQKNFDEMIRSVKELAQKNFHQCLQVINKIEATILSHEIRGIKILSYVSGMEQVSIKYSTTNPKLGDKLVINHLQNVLNNLEEQREDVDVEVLNDSEDVSFVETYKTDTPLDLYYKEMSTVGTPPVRNKRKEIEAKLNTIANRFHLINSIMSLCDDEDDGQSYQKIYGVSDLNTSFQNKYTKSPQYPEISEYMPKRLKSQIASLRNTKCFQKLLGGEIRISCKEQKVNYIISAGINFNAVELGLDMNNEPLAVKRIARGSWVGKILKTLIDPLLGLIDTHILHYFACEYEGNELILATPLCKWNLSQYVQLLRQSSNTTTLTAIQVVKQFLSGLTMLHKCEIPIVHGNLKPSNVFIDFNGLVKIAEFGMHKALYKIIEAPKSSLIWFAKETLDIYRNSSIVECSLKSDVQVAGMLLHFVITCGKHPFGDDTDEILKNISRGIPKLLPLNLDLRDLLSWMLFSEFNHRPNMDQVLSHPFFWSPAKKWNFISCCSGINQSGFIMPINVEKLHRSIDSFADSYTKIEWQDVVRNKFPNVRLSDNKNVAGLLKFIKFCHDHQHEMGLNETELSCTILSLFPILPAALYRILQNTNWLKHAVFIQFSQVF